LLLAGSWGELDSSPQSPHSLPALSAGQPIWWEKTLLLFPSLISNPLAIPEMVFPLLQQVSMAEIQRAQRAEKEQDKIRTTMKARMDFLDFE